MNNNLSNQNNDANLNTSQNLNQGNVHMHNPQNFASQINPNQIPQQGYSHMQGQVNSFQESEVVRLLKSFAVNWLNFKDRTSRRDYWMTALLLIPLSLLYFLAIWFFLSEESVGGLAFLLILTLPFSIANLALSFRRAVDVGFRRRGYLFLLLFSLVPYIGLPAGIFNLVMYFLSSNKLETNSFSGFSTFMFRQNPQVAAYYAQFNPYNVANQGMNQQFNQNGNANPVNTNQNLFQQPQQFVQTQTNNYDQNVGLGNTNPQSQVVQGNIYNAGVGQTEVINTPQPVVQETNAQNEVQETISTQIRKEELVQNVIPNERVEQAEVGNTPQSEVKEINTQNEVKETSNIQIISEEPVAPNVQVTEAQKVSLNQQVPSELKEEQEEIIGYSPFGDPIVKKVNK